MQVTYVCQNCYVPATQDFTESTHVLVCATCQQRIDVPRGAVVGNRVEHCLVCPGRDLYIRKDFPQRLGVSLVVLGIVGSTIAWFYANIAWTFGILFATALADLVLFTMVGNALMCYRCGAHYRGTAEMESHGHFDLETHEKYRQLAARARDSSRAAPAPAGAGSASGGA
ncbi:MAG: hypothetical protein IT424_13755 [Pirellulales bacterium]|nr:hypothetical protein [Pirellulales bacterium]